jgi:hypothetical protein
MWEMLDEDFGICGHGMWPWVLNFELDFLCGLILLFSSTL